MTPSKSDLETLRQKIEDVYQAAPAAVSAADVRRVVVILGSSRSGSSFLFHLLSQSGAFWCPQGEETPFYRMSGLGWVNVKEQSDAIRVPVDASACALAQQFLLRDVARPAAAGDLQSSDYISACAARVILQWPRLELEPARVVEAVRACAASAPDAVALWMNLTHRLGLEAGFYDLPGPKSRNLRLELPDYVLEEPPYIIPQPGQRPDAKGLAEAPLLLKTSTNVYRLAWLKTLFPQSEFRFIVLTRNPAACINGLMDGWLSHAFHSHNLQFVVPLKIRGYSDVIPMGDRWWKFDLPPGWTEFDDAPLPEVCAFQWRSAYGAILQESPGESLRVKYEDLIDPATAKAALNGIFQFAGAKPRAAPDPLAARPVMASQPPQAARWRARENEIWPQVTSPSVAPIAESLGYDLSSPDRLI
jgi:hypothetical protein